MTNRKYARPLTANQIDKLTKKGRHPEGTVPCLYVRISDNGAKSWVFMYSRKGRQSEIGLGSWTGAGKAGRISIPLARRKALAIHDQIAEGNDPLAEKRRDEVTFGKCADQLVESLKGGWSEKTGKIWAQVLTEHAAPLRSKPVAAIGVKDVLDVLKPLWLDKPETASRFRMKLERVFDYATARGLRTSVNPATWKGNLRDMLPKPQKLKRGHHPALPYADLPAFWTNLVALDEKPAIKPLRLTILTAARTSEVALAEWSEFDLTGKLWTVPARRSKTRKPHTVPLSDAALDLLRSLPRIDGEPRVFPDCGNTAMVKALQQIDGASHLTTHGFRSCFRDWCGNETGFPREVVEECLAHALPGGATERAYRRGEAIEKRRQVLDAWASYAAAAGKVVTLRSA